MGQPIRVLIVDDSGFVRKRLHRGLSRDPDIEVVGMAVDAFDAKDKLAELNPDVMTLDVEMPKLNGLDFLRQIMPVKPMPVIMVSSLTKEGASVTLSALAAGAVDFVAKPSGPSDSEADFMAVLCSKVHAASRANVSALSRKRNVETAPIQTVGDSNRVICIGSSTGGPEALVELLSAFPADAPPTVIVQHMPARYTPQLAKQLDRASPMRVTEAANGDRLESGHVYVAPGGMHAKLQSVGNHLEIACYPGEKKNGHIPSVDVLFESAAEVLGRRCVATILTGMGDDGAVGLGKVRDAGGRTLAEDESTCVVFGMPKAAQAAGSVEKVVPLPKMARAVLELVSGKRFA